MRRISIRARIKPIKLRHIASMFVVGLICTSVGSVLLPLSVTAGDSWFSGARAVPSTDLSIVPFRELEPSLFRSSRDDDRVVFDTTISLYNSPVGEERKPYAAIIEAFADSVCEQSNGGQRLGQVRIFPSGAHSARADVIWSERECISAWVAGWGQSGRHIYMGDFLRGDCNPKCESRNDHSLLDDTEAGGYVLGHEWGHYVLGLYDEYKGCDPTQKRPASPQTDDEPTSPAIMHSQWNARGGRFEWLNHSTADNIGQVDKTAQGRVYGKGGWETLVQPTTDDPRGLFAKAKPKRTRFNELVDRAPPDADGNWVLTQLPELRDFCRAELKLIWMDRDIELDLLVDVSGSMAGSPLSNAKIAAQNLVDVVPGGNAALGVSEFSGRNNVRSIYNITPIPDPGTAERSAIKQSISEMMAGGWTAMYDGLQFSLGKLSAYRTTNDTLAAQVVFLLSDGEDNDSATNQSAVTAAYQAAEIPIFTFAYGSLAPTGVLAALAADTGGGFYRSPTTLAEIQNAFFDAAASVTSQQNIASRTIDLQNTESVDFVVDSTLKSVTAFVSFRGFQPTEVNLVLNPPAVAASFDQMRTASARPAECVSAGGEVSCVISVDEISLQAGTWSLALNNTTGLLKTVNVNIVGQPKPARTYETRLGLIGGPEVQYPAPALVALTLSRDRPIAGANVSAQLIAPGGSVTQIPINDQGSNGDAVAGDGIYSAVVNYRSDGMHQIVVTVDNADGRARYTLAGPLPALRMAPGLEGTGAAAASFPSIEENFQRTASVGFTVTGFQTDDHGDAYPGCTRIPTDNTGVAGRIDFAGDVDCFVATDVSTVRNLVARVTDLAFDMRPVVRAWDVKGNEFASVTLDSSDALSGVGYPLIGADRLPGDLVSLVLTVEHEDPLAEEGAYEISVGAGIWSDQPDVPVDETTDRKSSGGCSVAKGGASDPLLPLLFLAALTGLFLRQRRPGA